MAQRQQRLRPPPREALQQRSGSERNEDAASVMRSSLTDGEFIQTGGGGWGELERKSESSPRPPFALDFSLPSVGSGAAKGIKDLHKSALTCQKDLIYSANVANLLAAAILPPSFSRALIHRRRHSLEALAPCSDVPAAI